MTTPWWLLGGGYRGFSMSAAFCLFGCFRSTRRPATGAPEDSPIEAEVLPSCCHRIAPCVSRLLGHPLARTLRTAIATSREDAGWIGLDGPWATSAAP